MCAIEQDQKQQQRQQQREHEVAVQGHTMFNKQKSESENERARMHAYCIVRTHCNMCGQSTHTVTSIVTTTRESGNIHRISSGIQS